MQSSISISISMVLFLSGFCLKVSKPTRKKSNVRFRNIFDNMNPRQTTTKSQVSTVAEANYYLPFTSAVQCERETLYNWSCMPCKKIGTDIKLIGEVSSSATKARAIITENARKQEIVITFRGSVNFQNYLNDLNIRQISTEYGHGVKVHRGAWKTGQSLFSGITRILGRELQNRRNYTVVLVGHSLGGMEASLFLFVLRNTPEFENLQLALYSYGQPRVGNLAFANWMNAQPFKIVRVVNAADFAPHVVSPSGFGYVHFNTELWIRKFDIWHYKWCSRKLLEDPKCSNSKGPFYNAWDHLHYFESDYEECPKNIWYKLANIAL